MQDVATLLIERVAEQARGATALKVAQQHYTYEELWVVVGGFGRALVALGTEKRDRIAIYLDKRMETVVAMFGAAVCGGVFVPINPLLRPRQVSYILRDCNVRVLVTSRDRLEVLSDQMAECRDLRLVVLVDSAASISASVEVPVIAWSDFMASGSGSYRLPRIIDTDMAAIFYTSGSTGLPKGVVLSHRNIIAGAESVSSYLQNEPSDRILAVLPLSFDAGFSQLTTAFFAGACVVMMNYLLPRDVVRLCAQEGITGLTGVPPLWAQLASVEWPPEAARSLRYFANTGGHMPRPLLQRLRALMPSARPFLMYGLTEAFRSTYLDPEQIDRRPDSIGRAIPNAEILVVREDGSPCDAGEEGELLHRGALVALGYWNDPERTAARFRPAPGRPGGLCLPEIAVWSGDIVRTDEEGFLYFVGRRDEMIKTSGYRVSPTEIEDVVYGSGLVGEAAAVGVPHPTLGQAIVVAASGTNGQALDLEALQEHCRRELPLYMVPAIIQHRTALPRTPNGKIDRQALVKEFAGSFAEA